MSADGEAKVGDEIKSVSTSMVSLVSYLAEMGQHVRALAQRNERQADTDATATASSQPSTSQASPGQGVLAC